MKYSITLAAIAATISTASATTATVKSLCQAPVYLYAVDAQRAPSSATQVLNYGDSYSEAYHTPSSGGVSLKLSLTPNLVDGHITQFEYTLTPAVGTFPAFIWYDGSNVNCQGANCPFYNTGVYMSTSDATCPTRSCPLGAECTGFYNLFNDDVNSLSCGPTADITMVLCSTDGVKPSSGGAAPAAYPSEVLNIPAAASSVPAAVVNPVANEVEVPTTAPAAAASPTPSAAKAVFQMEALHVPNSPASAHKHRRALMNRHAHMRRHAHAHQS